MTGRTFEQLAEAMYPPGAAENFAALRSALPAGVATDLRDAMQRPAEGIQSGRAAAMKLLSAEFGAEHAQAALDRAKAYVATQPTLQQLVGRSPALGNSAKAVLAIAKVATAKGNA